MSTQPKTYRGRTLEDVLPRIRDELGPDAVIVRRREGVTGGIGGFFAKRCIEVDAQRASEHTGAPALPRQQVFDAYDAGSDDESPVIAHVREQAGPFAAQLAALAARDDATDAELDGEEPRAPAGIWEPVGLEDDAAEVAAGEEAEEADDEPLEDEPSADVVEDEPRPRLSRAARRRASEAARMRARLEELGLPAAVVAGLIRDVDQNLLPFAPDVPYEEHLRQALAGQIRVRHGWRTKRRTVALVGAPGSGKTLTAAKLCHAYANASALSVGALSVESTADAYRLGALTDDLDIDIRVADTPVMVERAKTRLRNRDLVVVDTPPLVAGDPDGMRRLAELLAVVRPDETHLTLAAGGDSRAADALLSALAGTIDVGRILITRLDEVPSAAVPVGVSLAHRRPVSYVTHGRGGGAGLRPADAAELARLVLP